MKQMFQLEYGYYFGKGLK